MAWFSRSYRYAIGGIADPDFSGDWEQQIRFAFQMVPIAGELGTGIDGSIDATLGGFTVDFDGTFTPYQALELDYDEALSFHAIPEPASLDVTRRYALGQVPSIGFSDSIDRDGLIDTTLSGFAVDFDGTITTPGVDGDLNTTLDAFSASFTGAFQYRHYFDVSFSVTPTWVVWEQPANFGDIDITLGGFTTAFEGYALPPDSTQGRITTVISGFSVDFDGAYTAPPTFDGDIGLDIESFVTNFLGTSFASGTTGAVDLTLDSFTPRLRGTFEVWNTDGAFNSTLDGFVVLIDGQFTDSDATQGLINSNISGFITNLSGTSVLPADIDVFTAKIDSNGVMKARIDTNGAFKAKVED